MDQLEASDCGILECGCYGVGFRSHLEVVLHALPRKSARELRALVGALDEKVLARAQAIPADGLGAPWW